MREKVKWLKVKETENEVESRKTKKTIKKDLKSKVLMGQEYWDRKEWNRLINNSNF